MPNLLNCMWLKLTNECQLCKSLFDCSVGWLRASKTCKRLRICFSWVHGADTDVLINSHYIYMQFNLVPYRHRIDELWAVLASSKSFKYL